jgi:hypothetical protein
MYAGAQYGAAPVPRPTRPGVLTAGIGVSVLAAVLVVAAQLVSLATGRTVIQNSLRDALGSDGANLANALFKAALDDAYSTLQARAILGISLSALVLLFAALALRGRLAVRVTLAVVLGITAALTVVSVGDVFPAISKAAGGAAIAAAVGAIVLLFLPAANQFGAARKAARRG